jgi:hypothetical protein
MPQRTGLLLHLWFIAVGSVLIVATWSGPRVWAAGPWMATSVAAVFGALVLSAADRRARRRWIASVAPIPVAAP